MTFPRPRRHPGQRDNKLTGRHANFFPFCQRYSEIWRSRMNRALVLGVAVFFALVGVCLLGSDNAVVAGHGCSCDCSCSGNDCGCDCGGHGLFHRRKSCCGCSGHNSCCGNTCCNSCNTCCGNSHCCQPAPCGCCGAASYGHEMGAPVEAVEPAEAPVPAAQRKPFGFRSVNFRR